MPDSMIGRNTSHRRALLRNLVTSVMMEERVETTVTKAKAVRPLVEKIIAVGQEGRSALAPPGPQVLMTEESVKRFFETVAPRYGDRQGGYLRIVRTGFQKGRRSRKGLHRTAWRRKAVGSEAPEARRDRPRSAPISKGRWKSQRSKKSKKPKKRPKERPHKSSCSSAVSPFAPKASTGASPRGMRPCLHCGQSGWNP